MITRIYRSKSDIENLSRLKTIIPTGVDRYDYKGQVVHKPWGYEYLMYENKEVAIWTLYLKEQQGTSMHCHPNKKTSLLVIRGEVVCSTLEGFTARGEGEGIIIEPSVFHTTRAVSKGGALIIEIESPPNKRDLVRLKDAYGREGKGYESTDHMSYDTKRYEYVDFHSAHPKKRKTVRFGSFFLSLCAHTASETVHKRLRNEKAAHLCLLSGAIHDHEGRPILSAGEAIDMDDLRKLSHIKAFTGIMYLTLTPAYKRKRS